jgi:hypothetical protein
MHNGPSIRLANDGVAEDLDIFQQDYFSGEAFIPYWQSGQRAEQVEMGDGLEIFLRVSAEDILSEDSTWRVTRGGPDGWSLTRESTD